MGFKKAPTPFGNPPKQKNRFPRVPWPQITEKYQKYIGSNNKALHFKNANIRIPKLDRIQSTMY